MGLELLEKQNLLNSLYNIGCLKIDLQLITKEKLDLVEEFKNSNLEYILAKREDKNLTGSFKDKSIFYEMNIQYSLGTKSFAISSSGNAAISAIYFAKKNNLNLNVFVSNNINKKKLEIIKKEINKNINLIITKKPKSDCIKYCNQNKTYNLRGSTSDIAPIGYEAIIYEIYNFEEEKFLYDFDSIFLTTSSGTSTVGIYNALNFLNKPVPINLLQSSSINPIYTAYNYNNIDNSKKIIEESNIDCIVDNVCHRKYELLEIVKKTNGNIFIISNNDLEISKSANKLISSELSYNSMVPMAGLLKTLNTNIKKPLLIISGR